MCYIIDMRNFLLTLYCFCLVGMTVPTVDDWQISKKAPDHVGIDKELAPYDASYRNLALKNSIKFTKPVTIGFSRIKLLKDKKHVIGLCTYGKNFREIDIDIEYWKNASSISRRTLVYHEMTHCLCGRDHDWGEGTAYPDSITEKIIAKIIPLPFYKTPPGFMKDGCPLSVMHPYILSDGCAINHWSEYKKEMFNRCKPY